MISIRTAPAALAALFCWLPTVASAQGDFFFPNAQYDQAIPSFQDVFGYEPGERMTWHRDATRYFEVLEETAPDRVRVERYAESWEGRDLVYVILTSPENMARIDEIKANMQRLRDPRETSRADAEAIIASMTDLPVDIQPVYKNEL